MDWNRRRLVGGWRRAVEVVVERVQRRVEGTRRVVFETG